MKIEANNGYLMKLLQPLVSGGYKQQMLWLTADRQQIKAIVGNAQITASRRIYGERHKDLKYVCRDVGSGAVNAGDFAKNLKSFPSGQTVSIEFLNEVHITALPECDAQQNLSLKEARTDKVIVFEGCEKRFIIERELLVDALKTVRFAMGTEITKPYYMGISLEVSKGKMRCVAGSGAFFAVKNERSKTVAKEYHDIKIFLPASSISYIITSLSAVKSPNVECLSFDDGRKCVMTCPDIDICIAEIPPTKYVDVNKVLDFVYPNRFVVNMDDFEWGVSAMEASAKMKINEGQLNTVDIAVDNHKGLMVMKHGSAVTREVPLSLNSIISEPITLKVATYSLARVCKVWRGCGELIIRCADNDRPIVIEPKNKDGKKSRSNKPDIIFCGTSKRKEYS